MERGEKIEKGTVVLVWRGVEGGGNQAHADKPLSLKTGLMMLCLFG